MNIQRKPANTAGPTSRQTAREIDRHVAGRLRRRRKELGITQQMLARTLELSYQQIQKYETAANRIGAGRLACIAQALGVRPAYFFAGITNGVTPEDKALAALRGEGPTALEPAVRKAFFSLLESLD